MALDIGHIELKGPWDAHALPDDSIMVTPANRDAKPASAEIDHDEILQRAKAGWVTKNTAEADNRKDTALLAKERLAQMQSGASSIAVTQGFINRMATEIEFQMDMIRLELQNTSRAIEERQEKIDAVEVDRDSAIMDRDLEVRRIMREADEMAARGEELNETRTNIRSLEQELELAAMRGDTETVTTLLEEIDELRDAERVAAELYDEAEAGVDASRTRLDAIQEHIDGFETQLTELRTRVAELGDQAAELAAELEEYEAFHAYLTSEEVAERVARGEITLEELQANGMPDEVSRRVMGETVETTRGYDLSDARDLWVDMRRGLGEAANNFFESTGLSRLSENFSLAAANTPDAPDIPVDPAAAPVRTVEVPTPPPAGTTLG